LNGHPSAAKDFQMTQGIQASLRDITRVWPARHNRLFTSAGLFTSASLAAVAVMTVLPCVNQARAQAQTKSDRIVESFTCKDVMREPDAHREIAIAFLHGYLLGKSGNSKFNVEVVESQTNAFIEQCLDNPQSKAVDVMTKIKG
jgi:HdeA/HdeB family